MTAPRIYEVLFDSGDTLTFTKGGSERDEEWLATLHDWHYPFSESDVLSIIEWTRVNESTFCILYKWGMYASARLYAKDCMYETGTFIALIPFFKRVKTVDLGKLKRLTSH